MNTQILLNRIRTPDGTVLTSYHVHDFKTHKDANGYTYMVDGGTYYLRRYVVKQAKYEELSEYYTGDHEEDRKHYHWGGRGIQGDQPIQYRPVCELATDHIESILETQTQIKGLVSERLFRDELIYRAEKVDKAN